MGAERLGHWGRVSVGKGHRGLVARARAWLVLGAIGMCGCGSSGGDSGPSASAGGSSGGLDASADSAPVDGSAASGGVGGTGGGECSTDDECSSTAPVTTPAGCAEWACDLAAHSCFVRSRDKDVDGHRGAACKAVDGTPITTGDDCDDNDDESYPGAWDGPQDATHPDRCDGSDQNCSGDPDEERTADGRSCSCTPGDTLICDEDGGGKKIPFPVLDGNGKPVGKCTLGKKTCANDGKWGACVGAVPPDNTDVCNGGIDDDCDGAADIDDDTTPPNLVTWTYDGDSDGYGATLDPTVKAQACNDTPPTSCPASAPACTPENWKLGNLPAKDCDDTDGDVNPAGVELCDDVDNDCNGTIDDDYANNSSLWYFDYDGDNYGDIDTTPQRSCKPPSVLPDGCNTLQANVPVGYCAGLAGEGSPPICPPPACSSAMWKRNIPNTDCKDRPDQALTGVPKGSDPKLVYPGATDLCNDRDYNCDGSGTTGCGCSPVGATTPCGSIQTCNLANQVCVLGGTWDTSLCLPDKARFDYCPDDDTDGYCDLTRCVLAVCPNAYPVDGHKYRERTACLGFATPNLGGSDCSDDPALDPSAKNINPGLQGEVCNGNGKDYNCNGKSNVPGAGDCECVNGGPVACRAPGHAFLVSAPPDTFPYAADPVLSGICQWDHKSCINGAWTTCQGGTGAYTDGSGQIAELCNGDGLDHDCNGKGNRVAGECECQPGDTQICGYVGNEVGICKRGHKDCIGGTFAGSPCVGAVYPTTRDCASSVDSNCDGSPDNIVDGTYCGCLYGTIGATCGTHPEDGTGTCKSGKRDCTYVSATKKTTWGACVGSVAPNPNGEACGPVAPDIGCDGKPGNGPGCLQKLYYGVLDSSTWVGFPGPREYMLMSTTTEGPFAQRYTMWAYAKQPVGTGARHFRRCYYCASGACRHMVARAFDSTSSASCTGTAEGIAGWLWSGAAPAHTKAAWFIGDKPPGWIQGTTSQAFVPMNIGGTPATPVDYFNNWWAYVYITQQGGFPNYKYDFDPNTGVAVNNDLWAPDP